MRRFSLIFALVGLGILGCGKRTEQLKVYKDNITTIPKKVSPDKREFSSPRARLSGDRGVGMVNWPSFKPRT